MNESEDGELLNDQQKPNDQTDSEKENKKEDELIKCQKNDEEVTKKKSANNFIEFNNVKVFCKLSDDQLDGNLADFNQNEDLLTRLFDENGNLLTDQLDNLESILEKLSFADNLARSKFAEKLFNLIQSNCLTNLHVLNNLTPLIIQLIHPTNKEEIIQDELYLKTRKYGIDAFNELLKQNGSTKEEQKVNDFLNQLRYFCSDLHKLNLNQQSNELSLDNLAVIEHPIDAICNLMKISFDEHFRNLICKLGGIEAISELLVTEHQFHGFLFANYDQIKKFDSKKPEINTPAKIDQKWINSNCLTLRRYTAMSLTNLTFGDKQSKIQLCLDIQFLDSLLAQLDYLFCEELIQVTSSVLRNLSWKASKICKTVLSELNSAGKLMGCSMQVKKETTLKCILFPLWNFSSHNMLNKQQICEVDGSVKYLISLLEYRSTNSTLTILENITGVFKNISSFLIKFDDLRKQLRINNCHEILLRHLKSTSLTVVCNCVGILWNISKDNLLDQKILINLGAINFLKNLTFSKHKIIAIPSKGCLKNLLTSECLKNSQFDLESVDFKALSMDSLNRANLFSQPKRMLLRRELSTNLKEIQSINNELSDDKKNQKSNCQTLCLNNQQQRNDNNNHYQEENTLNKNLNNPINNSKVYNLSSQSINSQLNEIKFSHKRNEVLDVSHSASDYFDLYKDSNNENRSSYLNENFTIDHLIRSLKEQNLDTILSNDLKFYSNNPNMVTSCFATSSLQNHDDLKRSSVYSTISEPVNIYYENTDRFTFSEKDLNELVNEELLEEEYNKLSFNKLNDFHFYNSSSVFHAYPVIIQESNECLKEADDLFDDDLYSDINKQQNCSTLNKNDKNSNDKNRDKKKMKKNLNLKDRSSMNNSTTIASKIPVPVQIMKPFQAVKPADQNKQKQQRKNNAKEPLPNKGQNGLLNASKQPYVQKADQQTTDVDQAQKTKPINEIKKPLKSKLPKLPKLTKSKTLEKDINTFTSLPKSRTDENLCNRTYDLICDDLDDEINNDNTEHNDLTYNVDMDKRINITYILPSSESDRTLKNETETDERTLVWQPDNEDEKTDKNLEEINTYVQNFSLNNNNNDNNLDDDDDATLHISEVNLEIDSTSTENLNLVEASLDNGIGTEIVDSFSFIETTRPPRSYDQINYSITSSLNNSLFNSNDQLSFKNIPNNRSFESSTANSTSSKSSRLRSPKAKVFSDLSNSPPTNTFTITKSTAKLNKSKDQSNQALSTSGYQTSLNSSIVSNNSFGAIDKINPPSMLNQISGISSLNGSANDCVSTCESISSINSDIYDLSIGNSSLNSSFNGSPFKKQTKTSTPKHQLNRTAGSRIAKPVTRLTNGNSSLNKPNQTTSQQTFQQKSSSRTDTFRKNTKCAKKSTTTSLCSSTISSTSSKSDHSTKTKSAPLKASNQDNLKKRTIIPASKSMSKISSVSSNEQQQSNLQKKKVQSKISTINSLWKKTVSNQQNISSKVFKKKSTTTSSLDKKDRLSSSNNNGLTQLTRSSTFEKLPTSNDEANRLTSTKTSRELTNKNKIRPIELQQNGKTRSVY